MKRSTKSLLLKAAGLIVSIAPVSIVVLNYFPLWKNRSPKALLSGFAVLLLLICFYPLVKAIKKYFHSPSVFTVWMFLFIAFILVESIAYEMTVISFVGMVSNLIGAVLFKLAKRRDKNEKSSQP